MGEVANSGSQDLDSFKQEVERKILELFDTTEDQGSQIESLTSNLGSVNDQSNRTLEDVVVTQAELAGMKKIVGEDHELIVRRVAEQKEAADLELASMSARFDRLEANAEHELREVEEARQRAESASEQCTSLEVRCGHIDVSTREQSSLVLAVEKTLTDRLEEIHELIKENYTSNTGELRSLRGEVAGGTENMWTLVVEIYSALRGSTLVLKSARGEGAPGGRARGLPDDRQLQRPAGVQAGRRRELHLLLRRLLLLAGWGGRWSPVRLAAEHDC